CLEWAPGTCLTSFQGDGGRGTPGGRLRRPLARADEMLHAEIARRRAGPPGDDVLSLLLAARDETGAALSAREVRDELVTLLIAGYEATAAAIAWTAAWLASDAAAAERARADGAYLDAARKEAVRLRPTFQPATR